MGINDTAVAERSAISLDAQLDQAQIHKASKALLKHLKESGHTNDASAKTKNLLEPDRDLAEEPVWLITTTKKHIVPQKRLKPSKILLPHPILTSPTLSICLITPDPQRTFKDVTIHPSFPTELSSRISRVIDVKKLEKKYHSFESKRQLLDSHDLFLADDRIITYLPKILGKTFYTSTSKRPIPICLKPSKTIEERKKNAALPSTKPAKNDEDPRSVISPSKVAQEIERTLRMTMIYLTPSATTAVRVGLASLTPDQLAENIKAVAETVVEKFVPRKWNGVKAIHIKGPNSVALPIWLADKLWEGEEKVLEEAEVEQARIEALPQKKKRRMLEEKNAGIEGKNREAEDAIAAGGVERSRKRKAEDADFSQEMRERREKLRQHKNKEQRKIRGGDPKPKALVVS